LHQAKLPGRQGSTDIEDYDRAIEFERLGGDIIELPATEWAKIEAK
jgi:hypothetical protein